MPLHNLINIKITKYFNYKPRFNGVSLRDNLPRIKDGAYTRNLDDKVKEYIGFHQLLTETWLCALIILGFNIFPEEVLSKIKDKFITIWNVVQRMLCGDFIVLLS